MPRKTKQGIKTGFAVLIAVIIVGLLIAWTMISAAGQYSYAVTLPVSRPDMVAKDDSAISGSFGKAITLYPGVKNIGNVTPGYFTVIVRHENPRYIIGYFDVPGETLYPNTQKTQPMIWNATFKGNHTISVWVDIFGEVPENNEGNNVFYRTITIS